MTWLRCERTHQVYILPGQWSQQQLLRWSVANPRAASPLAYFREMSSPTQTLNQGSCGFRQARLRVEAERQEQSGGEVVPQRLVLVLKQGSPAVKSHRWLLCGIRARTRAAARVLAGEDNDLKVVGVPHIALYAAMYFFPHKSQHPGAQTMCL